MVKPRGWTKVLGKMVFSKGSEPFEWGVNDCMTLAAESVKIMTGLDPMAGWGKYSTKHEAIKTVKAQFGLSFLETFTRIFEDMGFQRVTRMGLGCVGFIRTMNLDREAQKLFGGVTLATGLSDSGHVVCPGRDGLVVISRYELERAWKL
jgi:hypothetical protein